MEHIIISFLCGLFAGLVDVYLLNSFFRSVVDTVRGSVGVGAGGNTGGVSGNKDNASVDSGAVGISRVIAIPFAIFRWAIVGIIIAVAILLVKVDILPMVVGLTIPIFVAFIWRIYKFFQE